MCWGETWRCTMGADTLTAIRRNCRAVFTLLETHINLNKVLL